MMKRVPASVLEFDPGLVRDMMGIPCTNRKQLEISIKVLNQVIQNDLTDRQRELIILRYYQNMKNKQIAEYLHLDSSTVSRTLSRARRRIYQILHVYMEYLYQEKLED